MNLWAKLAPGQPTSQLRVSIQRTFNGVTNFNTVVQNTTVTADQWVRLRATYDFVFNYTSLTLYVESSSGTASFYIDDFDLTFVPPPVAERDIASVHETLAPYFPIGAAVWQGDLAGERAFLLEKHFNSITSENDMKWSSLQPTEGNFTFAAANAQVALAKANAMQGPRSHARLAQPGAGVGLQRREREPADADAGEQGPAAAAAGEPHPRRGRSLQERRLRLGRGQRGDRSGAGRRLQAQPLVQHHGHRLHRSGISGGARGRSRRQALRERLLDDRPDEANLPAEPDRRPAEPGRAGRRHG